MRTMLPRRCAAFRNRHDRGERRIGRSPAIARLHYRTAAGVTGRHKPERMFRMLATLPLLDNLEFPTVSRGRLETLQVNLGYRCNQRCLHCHVNASPDRTEMMDRETVEKVLA